MSSSPEPKNKKKALPSLLSNFRNAQAAIGRVVAADDLNERDMREVHYPLMGTNGDAGVGGRMATPSSSRPSNLQRGPPPSSNFVSTFNNFSQRFGNQLRKRQRRKKASGSGASGVPQEFYYTVGCFFFAFPVIFILYILARHSVFGDEGYGSGTAVQKHEVPANNVVDPDDEIRGAGFGVNQNVVDGETAMDFESQEEIEDDSRSASSELGVNDEADQSIIIGDTSGQSESVIDSDTATKVDEIEDSTKNMADARQYPKEADKSASDEVSSTSEEKENVNTRSLSDQTRDIVVVVNEKKSHQKLRLSNSKANSKE
ncbi:hypothetical protein ACHAXA_001132 [Cyclostephanos tholiformis]|uniref:Uncharacterized protein n=1 Tax=Cyclostephanos tholiformis TaxID=382380 RepID=A0ABD3R4K9_9STRA